jgi:hypothetical protein
MEMTMEAQLDRNELRRFAAEARAFDRLDRQISDAADLVGELVTGDYYINVRSKSGRMTGAIRRFSQRSDALHYLIRNRYV